MAVRADAESQFVQHLPYIERAVAALARRYGLRGDDADDFASWAKMRLIENDYAVLGKFRGESSLPTYLTVVLSMLGREYLVQQRGRWRPSAAARRAGPLATRLETLIYRDHLSLGHAGEHLRTSGETTLSDRDLAALLATLPRREPIRPMNAGDNPLTVLSSHLHADEHVDADSNAAEWKRAQAVLTNAVAELPDEERVVVQLRFWETLSVADIARALGVPQKPLYRRLEHALKVLRTKLESAGISREIAAALVSTGSGESPESVPSIESI